MTDHTAISQVSRLEVISTGARRRWTLAEKQRIVAESYSAPRVVSATARRNGLSASQLFTWRRLARAGRLIEVEEAATFAPAIISREASSTSLPPFTVRVEGTETLPLPPCPVGVASRIEIVLACSLDPRTFALWETDEDVVSNFQLRDPSGAPPHVAVRRRKMAN